MNDRDNESTILARERTRLATERTRLANERTFLAWTRTGLANVAGGLAIIRFLVFNNLSHQVISKTIGCLLVLLGIVIFGLSFFDYQSSYKKLELQPENYGTLWGVSAISVTLIIVAVMLLLIEFHFI